MALSIKNYRINMNDIVVSHATIDDLLINLISVCNTGASMTLSIYKKDLLTSNTFKIINANSTFVYFSLRLQKGWELHIASTDGTADIDISTI